MASKQVLLVIGVVATVAAVLAASALADDLLVPDSDGWRLNFYYDAWVDANDFIVGDTLVFKYAKGRHSVVQATAESFAASPCSQANGLAVWTSGDDRVPLNTSGPWWFFCGVADHCDQGMRFNVTVLPAVKLAPSPSASPPARAQGRGVTTAVLAAGTVAAAALLF